MDYRITQPIIDHVLHRSHEDDVCLDDKSFGLLLEIQQTLFVFEPIEDDEARKIWIEIPRGTAEEWKVFEERRRGIEYRDVELLLQPAGDDQHDRPAGRDADASSTPCPWCRDRASRGGTRGSSPPVAAPRSPSSRRTPCAPARCTPGC